MVLMEITWKVSHRSSARLFVESLVATKPSRLNREAERKKTRVVGDVCDPWENVPQHGCHRIGMYFRDSNLAVDKQVHTQSLDSVGTTYCLHIV